MSVVLLSAVIWGWAMYKYRGRGSTSVGLGVTVGASVLLSIIFSVGWALEECAPQSAAAREIAPGPRVDSAVTPSHNVYYGKL